MTGFADNLAELSSKYVQFATELGHASVVHYLWYPGWTDGQYRFQVTEQAAQTLKVKLRPRALNDISEVDDAMATMKKAGASVIIVQPSPFTFLQRERIVASATSHGLATIFAFRPAAAAGALITYGPDYGDLNRRAASYLARILRGTNPATSRSSSRRSSSSCSTSRRRRRSVSRSPIARAAGRSGDRLTRSRYAA